MTDGLRIFIIAIGILAVALLARKIWALTAGQKRRELQELVRRRREDAEREEFFSYGRMTKRAEKYRKMQKLRDEVGPIFNEEGHRNEEQDDTKTWPGPEQPA